MHAKVRFTVVQAKVHFIVVHTKENFIVVYAKVHFIVVHAKENFIDVHAKVHFTVVRAKAHLTLGEPQRSCGGKKSTMACCEGKDLFGWGHARFNCKQGTKRKKKEKKGAVNRNKNSKSR